MDSKWPFITVIALFALGAPLMYVELKDKREREHEAHLERMEALKRGFVSDGGVP